MNKRILVEYARFVALEAKVLTKELAEKLVAFDENAIKQVLEQRIRQLDSKPSTSEFFPEEYRKSQADAVREVLENLDIIPD